jgi:hypothetical protein
MEYWIKLLAVSSWIQRSEVRGQRSEVRGQRSEVRGQRSWVRAEERTVRGGRQGEKDDLSSFCHSMMI